MVVRSVWCSGLVLAIGSAGSRDELAAPTASQSRPRKTKYAAKTYKCAKTRAALDRAVPHCDPGAGAVPLPISERPEPADVHAAVRVGQKVILHRYPFSVVAPKASSARQSAPHGIRRLAGDLLVYGTLDADQIRFLSPCFSGSSYQTEMAITATLRFTGLPVR